MDFECNSMAKSIDFPYSSIFLFNSQKKKGFRKKRIFLNILLTNILWFFDFWERHEFKPNVTATELIFQVDKLNRSNIFKKYPFSKCIIDENQIKRVYFFRFRSLQTLKLPCNGGLLSKHLYLSRSF